MWERKKKQKELQCKEEEAMNLREGGMNRRDWREVTIGGKCCKYM